MCKKIGSLLALFAILFVTPSFSQLLRKKIEIDEKEVGYIKSVTDIANVGDNLFIADFIGNRVLRFGYSEAKLVFSNLIGRPGQGPGDIQGPLVLSPYRDHIAIKDQESISIFSSDGIYLNRFRQFSSFISFVLGEERVYYLATNPSTDYLLSILSPAGKLLTQALEKKLWINKGDVNTASAFREKQVYDGQLWSNGKRLYYVSKYFGIIEEISLSGELVQTRDISEDLGSNAKNKIAINKKILVETDELKLNKGRTGSSELFLDSYLDSDSIYILMSQHDEQSNTPIFKIDIRQFRLSDLTLSASYTLDLGNKEWLSNLCVKTIDGKPIFIVDISSEEGQDLYEISVKK